GENELSRNLISLSPLPTAHPSFFQQTPVRSSSGCYPTFNLAMGRSSRFAENELSRNLISLSPLPTAHPSFFQQTPVRSSSGCYPTFNLAMGRSSRFASIP